MALKDIFTMVKADRYTADGCEVLNKVREADVEDRRYNIGEISEKTGLQKTANGWVKPKSGKQPGAKTGEGKTPSAGAAGLTTSQIKEFKEMAEEQLKKPYNENSGITKESYRKAQEHIKNQIAEYDKELAKRNASKPAESSVVSEPKHTLEVGSEVKFKRSGQPIKIKEIENYGGTPVVVGEYDYNGKKETNRFRLDELEYDEKEEKPSSENKITVGNTVKFKKNGQPIKIKDIKNFGGTQVIEGEYEHNGKTETNLFRMDEISTDSAPRVLTGDCRIRVRKA